MNTATINVSRNELCDILLAVNYVKQTVQFNDDATKWDKLADKIKEQLNKE